MWNPDLLPRSKLASFFPEGAGKVARRSGQPHSPAVAPPPAGDLREVLIHLPYYENWKPPTTPSPDSGVSGLPSSVSSSPMPFPEYQEFLWHEGVLDGRVPVRRAREPC